MNFDAASKLADLVVKNKMCDSVIVAGTSGEFHALSLEERLITVAPELCIRQWRAFKAGHQAEAIAIQKMLTPIVATYLRPPYPPKVKALINLQGRQGGFPRKPALPVKEPLLSEMRAALQNAGWLAA